MEKALDQITPLPNRKVSTSLLNGLGWGCLGGMVGTLVMDLLLMAIFWMLGESPLLCFSIVGDTVARFAALFNSHFAGGVPTGMVTHYVVGPLFGILFGTIVIRLLMMRHASLKKFMLAALVYVEILSLPIVATTPLLLKMESLVTLAWFGGSLIMHLVMSIVLGLVTGTGLRRQSMHAREPRQVRL